MKLREVAAHERGDVVHVFGSSMPGGDFNRDFAKAREGILQKGPLQARPIEPEKRSEQSNVERDALKLGGIDVRQKCVYPWDRCTQRDGAVQRERLKFGAACQRELEWQADICDIVSLALRA